jgi:hypothetical protein
VRWPFSKIWDVPLVTRGVSGGKNDRKNWLDKNDYIYTLYEDNGWLVTIGEQAMLIVLLLYRFLHCGRHKS